MRAIEDRRPQITALDLREVNAVWGGLILRAAGELTVDAAGLPEGVLSVRAENWREMVAMAVRADLLPEQMRGTIEGLLGVVAGLSGDPEVIDAELTFSGRADLPRAASRGTSAAPDPALAAVGARTVGRHVEMEVIAVEAVGIGGPSTVPKGPQAVRCASRRMRPSRCVFQWSSTVSSLPLASPIPAMSIGVAARMLAQPRAALRIARPASIGGDDPEVGDPAARASDGGRETLAHPCLQSPRPRRN